MNGRRYETRAKVLKAMAQASYNRDGPNLTFMDGCRMISLYPSRIAVAKADEIVDGWRVLEMIRCPTVLHKQ